MELDTVDVLEEIDDVRLFRDVESHDGGPEAFLPYTRDVLYM